MADKCIRKVTSVTPSKDMKDTLVVVLSCGHRFLWSVSFDKKSWPCNACQCGQKVVTKPGANKK